ncbi:hypothetical protein C2G38_2177532 [Gigaspora rosea]|uniref:Uncharacterized protein n=1 Tax=Gigaspora rosea TaxID=44941 RepID=A0A397VH12_9GLOM|nr:hypothetical protein C2G38_2177532 [Gigaspora rosea]
MIEMLSEEEFEFDIRQKTNFNKYISDENEEDSKETIVHFISNLAVNANNMYYSTVSVEYPSTSSQNSQGLSDQRKCQGVTICPHIDNQIKSAKHCNVDFDSEVFKMIKDELAIIKKPYSKTSSNSSCTSLPVLRKIKENTLMQYRNNSSQNNNRASQILQCNEGYFIGCSLWLNGDSWYRFISILESCNINIIRCLLNGELFDRSLIQDKCSFSHLDEHNQPYKAQLENMSCEHTYPPSPSSHVPEAIQNQLKSLIETTSRDLEHVTPRKLISDTNF